MSSAGLQGVQDLKTLLTNNWTAANTDNITPLVTDNLETPWQDLDFGAKDHIYIKYDTEIIKTGLYAADFFHDVALTIEVMAAKLGTTQAGRAHFKKLVDEAVRIIKANARQSGYAKTIVTGTRARFVQDRGIFLASIEVELLKVRTS